MRRCTTALLRAVLWQLSGGGAPQAAESAHSAASGGPGTMRPGVPPELAAPGHRRPGAEGAHELASARAASGDVPRAAKVCTFLLVSDFVYRRSFSENVPAGSLFSE